MSDQDITNGRSYFYPRGIDPRKYVLNGTAIPDGPRKAVLAEILEYTAPLGNSFLGYQSTAKPATNDMLSKFLEFGINNVGDSFADPKLTGATPSQFADGYFNLNTKWVERAVLDYYATRWNAGAPRKVKEDPAVDDRWLDTYWGYVLSMGATEGNLMALRSARDYLKGRKLRYEPGKPPVTGLRYVEGDDTQNSKFNPYLLFSKSAHYSVAKLAQMLEIQYDTVAVDQHGRMQSDDLCNKAEEILLGDKRPLAVLFNYGTTWTGALDEIKTLVELLQPIIKSAGMNWREIDHDGESCTRRGFWFHVDGALGAGYATHVKARRDIPSFDFSNDIQSICMSGHKWPGAPWPTGIYMTKNRYMMTNDVPAYIGSLDSTLAGSRSGIAPVFLWNWLASQSDEQRTEEVNRKLSLAETALRKIRENWDVGATLAPGSLAVVFNKPSDAIMRKYSLPANDHKVHLYCMRHVTEGMITSLVDDLKKPSPAMVEERSIPEFAGAREGW